MKRVLKVSTSMVVALVLMFALTVSALAAGSKSDVVEVTGADDIKTEAAATTVPALTEKIAAEKIGNVQEKELTVLWQQEVTATTPATLTFTASGVKDDQEIYLFHYNGSDWELVESGKGASISHKFDSLSPVGLVVRTTAAAGQTTGTTSGTTTTNTGDNSSLILWGVLMVVAAAGAIGTIAYSKKRKTN